MATFADLIAAVQALLSASGARAALQLNSATRERAFEPMYLLWSCGQFGV